MRLSGWTLIFPSQKSHSDRLLEDTYDLRPRNGKKIDFQGAYNIVTSILGTAYHDLCGNTDKMRIRAYWNEMKADATIYSWR